MPEDTARRETLLEVAGLSIHFRIDQSRARAVDDLGVEIARGEVLGLVGESGCGKSMTALAVMRLLPRNAEVTGSIRLGGVDLARISDDEMRAVRGARIAMVFQEPHSALNPVFTVGSQLVEAVAAHEKVSMRQARSRAVEAMREVNIPDPESRIDDYPHQLSGGMKQRVMIAMALLCRPDLLIADEPTTAVDVTVQAGILDLISRLRAGRGLAVLLISHDLGVVAGIADRVAIMYAGRLAEQAPVRELFAHALHPYTQGLLRARPTKSHAMTGGRAAPLRVIPGRVPNALAQPSGCRFHPRCPAALERCAAEVPPLRTLRDGHLVACHVAEGDAPPDWAWRGAGAAAGEKATR